MAASKHDPATRRLLGRNVRRIRLEKNKTQEELSLGSGITQSHISEIEAGKRNSSVDLVGTLARVLKVSVALLFEEREDPASTRGERND